MTDEQRNSAQDVLDGLLRDAYSRGYMDATSESKSTINNIITEGESNMNTKIKDGEPLTLRDWFAVCVTPLRTEGFDSPPSVSNAGAYDSTVLSSITEMMELVLTGANGSEYAVEGVMLNAIDYIKKLEEQNRKMYTVLKKLMEMRGDCFIPNEGDWWDNMAEEAIAIVEGPPSPPQRGKET